MKARGSPCEVQFFGHRHEISEMPQFHGRQARSRAARYLPQTYELATPDGPPTYFGCVGYEHNGRLFSPAVTVRDLAGVIFFSTQSVSTLRRLKLFGTGTDGIVLPSPSIE